MAGSDGMFYPSSPVTGEEAARALSALAEMQGFSAGEALGELYALGNQPAARETLAAAFYRYSQLMPGAVG